MTTLCDDASAPAAPRTLAERQAAGCWAANLRALSATQPALVEQIQSLPAPVQWVFGRDGALTAMHADGRWWNGCSVPRLAARAMLKELELEGCVGCLLAPTHAAQFVAALESLELSQAIVAVVPDEKQLRILLQCEDLNNSISGHRLWIACGSQWPAELERIFRENPGLPTPTSFIRIKASLEQADALVPAAREAIERVNLQRRSQLDQLQSPESQRRPAHRLLVIAPANFRLWDDAGQLLWETLDGSAERTLELVRFNPDDPASTSPLALALAAQQVDAILSANTARADLPAVVPADLPWITWITTSRIPQPSPQSSRDALLIADPTWKRRAIDAGWSADRVAVATWPPVMDSSAPPAEGPLVLIADASDLEPPSEIEKFSSHMLFWKLIREELLADPFKIGLDPLAYLARRMRECGIAEQGFDRPLFLERLIYPAYQQSAARFAATLNVPLRIHGQGWELDEDLQRVAADPVTTRVQLLDVVRGASMLLHPWPGRHIECLRHARRPILGPCRNRREFEEQMARRAWSMQAEKLGPILSESILRSVLER